MSYQQQRHEETHETTIPLEENSENHLKCDEDSQFCYKSDNVKINRDKEELNDNVVFLFYDVNPQEGFNLRRDVYMRVAILAYYLNQKKWLNKKWTLVLPPWNNLYHWKNKQNIQQRNLKWSHFFDIQSLNKFTSVIELETLLKTHKNKYTIDVVYYLELDQSDLSNGFEQFQLLEECSTAKYIKNRNGKISGAFRNLDVEANRIECIRFRGTNEMLADKLLDIIEKTNNRNLKSMMIDRAEVMLHQDFGQLVYWMCRRSMIINRALITKAEEIRNKYLNSSDQADNIISRTSDKIARSKNRGGPYIAVHLRRGDFFTYRPSKSVTLQNAASQIVQAADRMGLKKVYLATDGTQQEIDELSKFIREKDPNIDLIRYEPNEDELEELKDGGWAIVEQLLCAHAKYFMGTMESTYSLRIQEEREILGFEASTTFNALCNDNPNGVCKTSEWLIVY